MGRTATLLFSDIEGSTSLLQEIGSAAYGELLLEHHRILATAAAANAGVIEGTEGDGAFMLFESASGALAGAVDAQLALADHAWAGSGSAPKVRIGIHTGEVERRGDQLVGLAIHQAARISAAANGGQILLSELTASLASADAAERVALIDLGCYQLKDLPGEHRLFRVRHPLLIDDARPPRASQAVRTNLTDPPTAFIGRETELVDIHALLDRSHLVTIVGPGGTGKTRTAVQAAISLSRSWRDGIWMVELAAVNDPDLVVSAIAHVLGVQLDRALPADEQLTDACADRETMIVLDNCEHLIGVVAKVADRFVRLCPGVTLLATSREPLRVDGEQVYRLSALSLPASEGTDVETASRSDAVRLLVQRITQHTADFELNSENAAPLARLCRRLDGIPLAIELAAARLRALSIADLEARLDQRFRLLSSGNRAALPRHQALGALIDWSWDLLNSAEQAVLMRLCVFAGSWDIDAAEAIASSSDVEVWEVVDLVAALVDKSLVQGSDLRSQKRYRLLETVREYAEMKAQARGPDGLEATRAAHRDHYLARAEEAAPELISARQNECADRLEMERDNLRAALGYSVLDPRSAEPGVRLAVALRWFWQFRGPAVEGATFLASLLDRADAQAPTLLRGHALVALAALLIESGRVQDAGAPGDEALVIALSERDPALEAHAYAVLSWTRLRVGECDDALTLADSGLRAAARSNDLDVTTRLLNGRGNALGTLGDAEAALECFREARELSRRTGNQIRIASLLNNIGYFELGKGDLAAAYDHLNEGLSISLAANDTSSMNLMSNLGLVAYMRGDRVPAHNLFAQALATARRVGDDLQTAYALFGLALTKVECEGAIVLHGATDALFTRMVEDYEAVEAEIRDARYQKLRDEVGIDTFERLHEAGRDLDVDDAIALVHGDRG